MDLIATVSGHAYNNDVPYQSLVQSDHTMHMASKDILAMAYLSNFEVPHYPSDVFVANFPPNPPLDSGAHAFVSYYVAGGDTVPRFTLDDMSMADASHLHIDACTSVTFTAMVAQGWMSMIGMIYSDPPAPAKSIGDKLSYRVIYDGITGRVHYISETTVLPGGTAPSDAQLDDAARAAAGRMGIESADLRLLTTTSRPKQLGQLQVDLDSGRLTHAQPPRP